MVKSSFSVCINHYNYHSFHLSANLIQCFVCQEERILETPGGFSSTDDISYDESYESGYDSDIQISDKSSEGLGSSTWFSTKQKNSYDLSGFPSFSAGHTSSNDLGDSPWFSTGQESSDDQGGYLSLSIVYPGSDRSSSTSHGMSENSKGLLSASSMLVSPVKSSESDDFVGSPSLSNRKGSSEFGDSLTLSSKLNSYDVTGDIQSNFDISSDSYNSYSDNLRRKRVAESFSVMSDRRTGESYLSSNENRLPFCRENPIAMCAGECVVSLKI